MRRLLILAMLASMALPATAGATTATWPARCTTWTCVNAHLNNLNERVTAHGQSITSLTSRVNALTTRVTTLESRADSQGVKLNCLSVRPVFHRYSYGYNDDYFEYLNTVDSYGYGSVGDGPWRLIQERQTDSCVGIFS